MAFRRAENSSTEVAPRPCSAREPLVGVIVPNGVMELKKRTSRVFRPRGKDHYVIKDHAYYHRENHQLATVPRDRLHLILTPKLVSADAQCAERINELLVDEAVGQEKAAAEKRRIQTERQLLRTRYRQL
jgi:hypothetical protein